MPPKVLVFPYVFVLLRQRSANSALNVPSGAFSNVPSVTDSNVPLQMWLL